MKLTDVRLCEELIDPLLFDTNGLLSSCLVNLLVEPLRSDVEHQLLYVLWS